MAEEKKDSPAVDAESVRVDKHAVDAKSVRVDKQDDSSSQTRTDSASTEESKKPTEPDWKDLYARLKADFDNYKKRAARDRDDVYRYAESDILKDILPTVDNLALALANASSVDAKSVRVEKDDSSASAFVKGVQLVHDTLVKALKDHGAESFDSVGKELDTEKMEAITMMPSAEVEEGKVVAEVKKGWTLKGKTLRAAQVVVSSGKPA